MRDSAGAINKGDLDVSAATTLHQLSDGFFVGTEYMLPVFFFASAILALRYAFLPKWLGSARRLRRYFVKPS